MKTAYILLWFPNPTETFIFREVENLRRFGLPLEVYTLYGPWKKNLSTEMAQTTVPIKRLGVKAFFLMLADILYWAFRKPGLTAWLFGRAWLRRWRGFEKTGENVWCFLGGFRLARFAEADGIQHLHAPWANGPATAAWVASALTGIPYTFTARAWDIYPPDALIEEKISGARFVRSETQANIRHLAVYAGGKTDKFRLTYNGVPFVAREDAPAPMQPPVKLLSIGRLVRKKGYDQLLEAISLLGAQSIAVTLTIAGSGPLLHALERQARRLGIAERVTFTGFISYDTIGGLFEASDIFVMPCVIAPSGDRDGIPTVIMEALMHRLPVVTTTVSGIPELIEDGVTGYAVPEKNPEALAKAIRKCIEGRGNALQMAERGRERVKQNFNPEKNHRNVFRLYSQLEGAD